MGMNTYSLNMKLPLMWLFFIIYLFIAHKKIYWLVKINPFCWHMLLSWGST